MTGNGLAKKHEKLENWLTDFAEREGGAEQVALCLRAYVHCFNAGQYYEAHDVLEHAWLALPRGTPEWTFLKGLIQLAGGFVHLRLHYLEPGHRVHGRRLAPAGKLFALARANLAGKTTLAHEMGLDLAVLLELSDVFSPKLTSNPWEPEALPSIPLLPRPQFICARDAAGGSD